MKKIFLSLILMTIIIFSCQKNVKDNIQSSQNVAFEKSSSIRDSIDVSFDELVSVDHALSDSLGVNYFEIAAGTYYLVFNEENPFGIVSFDIVGNSPQIYNVGVKVKIARRHAPNCPNCECCCGIGFRCGFVTWVPGETSPLGDDRYLDAKVTINSGKMIIRMAEAIPSNW